MENKELTNYTNEELLDKKKKIQYNKTVNATMIGICIGIFIFSLLKNGFVFFTIFPLLLTYPFVKNGQKIKSLSDEIKSRNL